MSKDSKKILKPLRKRLLQMGDKDDVAAPEIYEQGELSQVDVPRPPQEISRLGNYIQKNHVSSRPEATPTNSIVAANVPETPPVANMPTVLMPSVTINPVANQPTTLMPAVSTTPVVNQLAKIKSNSAATRVSAMPTALIPSVHVNSPSDTPTQLVPSVHINSSSDTPTALMPSIPNTPALELPPVNTHASIRQQIEKYAQWLELNNSIQVSPQKIQAYQDLSMTITKVKKSEVCTFAPFQESTSAIRVITPAQILCISLLVLAWVAGLFFLHMTMITITIAGVTLLYICGFVTSSILATNALSGSSGEKIDEGIIQDLDDMGVEWPIYTILCPLFKETAVVPQFVKAIRELDYPAERLQVLFLTEESDKETRAALYNMHLASNFTILTVPKGSPQTKPRACNFGLLQAKGQFVVIFDAEDQPETYQLKKAVLTFANHGSEVACVQAKLNYYNSKQNLLTRWFTAEYSTWFDIMLPGLQRSGLSIPLGGTSNHFRTEVLRALGGWDAFNVTEDCDLGLRISQYGLKTAVLDSTTYEEATSSYKTWLFQRSRWNKGYMQTYLVHMRHPLRILRRGHIRKFLSLQVIVGSWTAVLLINPIMWALTISYIIFRPDQLYNTLFPAPVLYMGTFCLVFGNFFYIYVQLVGCLRRKEYSLIKWILLLPLYWVMMSMAAYIAFYQLIVKPHYWEKTQHGNHLAAAAKEEARKLASDAEMEGRSVVSSMPTSRVAAIRILRSATASLAKVESTTQRVVALRSSLSKQLGPNKRRSQWPLVRMSNPWLIMTICIAIVASIAATTYNMIHNDILLYSDAYFHLRIARRVFDSATPGIGQLGTTWVPLPHILMLPFIWNDYLWRTGLAGSIPSMICYLASATYLFLTIQRLTKDSRASFVGALLFILNPNILYLQSTPLSELVCIITLTMAGYYFLGWIQDNRLTYLVFAAASTCLATMSRYDGWALFAVLLILVPIVGIVKRHKLKQIEGNFLVFLTLGMLGIILWLLYNMMLSGNAFYFLQGPFSSKVQTLDIHGARSALYAYHNIWEAIRFYSMNSIETLGPLLFFLGFFALLVFVIRKRFNLEALAVLTFFVPFAFYVASLYTGQATLFVPGAVPASASLHNQLFNTRFGAEMVVPMALCIATLGTGWRFPSWRLFWSGICVAATIIVILAQTYIVASNGIITLDDGLYGVSCEATHAINPYLAQHYNGGKILEEIFSSPVDGAEGNFDFSNIIWEGSYHIWPKALQNPGSVADWIILNPTDPTDLVAQNINLQSPQFQAQFTLVVQEPAGLRLYHKNGLPALPTRPIPSYIRTTFPMCDAAS